MTKIGILFPLEEMLTIGKPLIEKEKLDIVYVEHTETAEVVNEARRAISEGAEILISRGYQAALLKRYTNTPIVDMRIHAQEVGLLIKKIKTILNDKKDISIGLITYENMLCDMSEMEMLFDVKLKIKYINRISESIQKVNELKMLGVDYIIGGEVTCKDANSVGIPALIYGSSEESIQEALREAKKLSYAMDIKREKMAQYSIGLSNGALAQVEVNQEFRVLRVDAPDEGKIDFNIEDTIGKSILEILPNLDQKLLHNLLEGKTERISSYLNIDHMPFLVTGTPVKGSGEIVGAYLYFYKLNEKKVEEDIVQTQSNLSGYIAAVQFDNIHTANSEMQKEVEAAKRYAQSDRAVLIYTEEGTEYYMFAEAIHNASHRRNGPFVSINLDALDDDEQMLMLFGKDLDGRVINPQAAFIKANNGTLFIKGLDKACSKVQYQIARTMISKSIVRTDSQRIDFYDVRVIASSKSDLKDLVEMGMFSEELFYLVQGLIIRILPLRTRKEDLLEIFEHTFERNCKKYNKQLKLTAGAKDRVTSLRWPGNHIQILAFCENLVLMANKKNVDEVQIQNLYDSLYPNIQINDGKKHVVVYSSPEAEEINKLLEQYHGSRNLVAQELGISTTTLWRKMKKYGIEAKYQE